MNDETVIWNEMYNLAQGYAICSDPQSPRRGVQVSAVTFFFYRGMLKKNWKNIC